MTGTDPCPRCGAAGSRVVDSRPYAATGWRRRRRKCDPCGHLWTTLEFPVEFLIQFGAMLSKIETARTSLEEVEQFMRSGALPPGEDLDG